MGVLVYIGVAFIAVMITGICSVLTNGSSYVFERGDSKSVCNYRGGIILLANLFIVTIILSWYSAQLATSGKLVDTVRYAWNFLYRYPTYYHNSLKSLFDARTEPGFLVLNRLIKGFTSDPFWLFFIIACTTTSINLYVLTRLGEKRPLLVAFYLISPYFFHTTYLLRQTLAVSIGNLAFLSYQQGKRHQYFFFSVIALMFHSTAIILLPLYFILKRANWRTIYFYIPLIGLLTFLFFGPVLNFILPKVPYIGQYINIYETGLFRGGGSASSVLKGIPFYFVSSLALARRRQLSKAIFNADSYIVSCLFYSVSWLFTYNMYWFFRLGWYLLIPTLVIIPELMDTIRNPKQRLLYYGTLIFMMLSVTIRQIHITLN